MRALGLLMTIAWTCAACAPAPASAPPAAPASPAAASSPAPAAPAAQPTTPAAPAAPITPSDVVAANRAPFDACYAQARTVDPKLGHTKVEMSFAIDELGKPKTVDFKYNRRLDDHAKDCMRDAALGLHFPPSMQGVQTATLLLAPPSP